MTEEEEDELELVPRGLGRPPSDIYDETLGMVIILHCSLWFPIGKVVICMYIEILDVLTNHSSIHCLKNLPTGRVIPDAKDVIGS